MDPKAWLATPTIQAARAPRARPSSVEAPNRTNLTSSQTTRALIGGNRPEEASLATPTIQAARAPRARPSSVEAPNRTNLTSSQTTRALIGGNRPEEASLATPTIQAARAPRARPSSVEAPNRTNLTSSQTTRALIGGNRPEEASLATPTIQAARAPRARPSSVEAPNRTNLTSSQTTRALIGGNRPEEASLATPTIQAARAPRARPSSVEAPNRTNLTSSQTTRALIGGNRPEHTVDVHFGRTVPAVRPGRVEERRARSGAGAVAERDPPDSRGLHRQTPAERPAAGRSRIRVDRAGAEVGDEEVSAEAPEARGRKRDAPGLVELLALADVRDEPSVEVELVDVAAGRRIVAVHRRPPRVGDEDAVAGRLDPERRVPDGDCTVDEGATPEDRTPVRVVDEHACVVKVGRVETVTGELQSH